MYTQYDEELVIGSKFSSEDPSSLTFLDIGANDGVSYSNSRKLSIDGWSGVCLEPAPAAFGRLSDIYPEGDKVRIRNYGISDSNGEKEFHDSGNWEGRNDTPPSILGTLDPGQKSRFYGMNWNVITCKFKTFEDFLEESEYKRFDFITIDVEGHDWVVLKQMNLRELGCRMLCVEYNGNEAQLALFTGYCTSYGLEEIYRNTDNVIFSN